MSALVQSGDFGLYFNTSTSNQTGIITYSSNQSMQWFQNNEGSTNNFGKYLGRYGDEIQYKHLSNELKHPSIKSFGRYKLDRMVNKNGGTVVCGFQSYVQNDVYLSNDRFDDNENIYHRHSFKGTTWAMLALSAPDQLRQRMAWSLNQIIPISPDTISESDAHMQFYDIFVRNAFGNYRDILRQVAYSAQMGEMLTYTGNESIDRQWFSNGKIQREFESSRFFRHSIVYILKYILIYEYSLYFARS